MKNNKSAVYSVSGTHCHACEILIEKEIKSLSGIKSVEASTSSQTVKIIGKKIPEISFLNKLFKDSGYSFSSDKLKSDELRSNPPDIFLSLLIVLGILAALYIFNRFGFFSSFNVNASSYFPAFIIFGLLAGFSTCAALVGGIVLGVSRRGLTPVINFLIGRLVFFAFFGAVLGYFGSFFRLSLTTGAIISILVALVMIVSGLQLLNFKFLNFLNFSLPKSITGRFADESKFQGQYLPIVLGGLTFFLPCGFTLTTQSLALASGSIVDGALIMFSFALGSFIPLFLIGYGSIRSQRNPTTAAYFSQVAGILVVLFALYTLYTQSIVLGFSPPVLSSSALADQSTSVPIVSGVQIIKMDASASGYNPSTFTVRAGQKIRWEITDKGTSGCTNAVIARSLFSGPINLVPGTTSVKEFTAPTKPGTYRFSCWMGMVSGSIEVVE